MAVCSRPRDRLDCDASAHSGLAGMLGSGVVLFNPRLNLVSVALASKS